MLLNKFGLSYKIIENGKLVGFILVSDSGNINKVSVDKANELAKAGLIIGWSSYTDEDGESHLCSDEFSLQRLPVATDKETTNSKIVARINKDGKFAGYVCEDNAGNKKGYPTNKVWSLIRNGKISNAKAFKVRDNRAICSVEQDLKTLKTVNI